MDLAVNRSGRCEIQAASVGDKNAGERWVITRREQEAPLENWPGFRPKLKLTAQLSYV